MLDLHLTPRCADFISGGEAGAYKSPNNCLVTRFF